MNIEDFQVQTAHAIESRNRRLWFRRWGVVCLIALVFIVWFSWRYGVPAMVIANNPQSGWLEVDLFAPGILDGGVRSQLSSKISGRILELSAESGDIVTAGAVLVRLQNEAADALVHQAQAQLSSARAQLGATEAELNRAILTTNQALKEQLRLVHLASIRPSAASAQELDQVDISLAWARADESRAQAQRDAAVAAVTAAEAGVAYQRSQSADSILMAPFAGVVTQRIRSVGDMVVPGNGILELVDPKTLFIKARFDESMLGSLLTSAPARLVFHQDGNKQCAGHVARIDRVVDGETREFIAEIEFDGPPAVWALGQRVDVYVRARVEASRLLPREWLQWNSQGAFVWVVRDGRAQRQPITLGLEADQLVQVVSGIDAGDQVINPAGVRLYRGRRVYLVVAGSAS